MLKKLITSILQGLRLIEVKEEVKQEEPVVVEQPKVEKKKPAKKPVAKPTVKAKGKNEKKQTRSKK